MIHYSQEDLVVIEFTDQCPSIRKDSKVQGFSQGLLFFFLLRRAEVCKFYYNQVFLTVMYHLIHLLFFAQKRKGIEILQFY